MTATTAVSADYDMQRQRHVRAAVERLPAEIDKPTWPLERLHALRDERLRALLRTAKERSPWHAHRLRHIDPATVRGDDLSALPPMTKADLMEHWDEIVTDRRLTLERATAHLAQLDEQGPAYLLDEYHVVSSGGSSGLRGVFVWDFEGWLLAHVGGMRHGAWLARQQGQTGPIRAAGVSSARPIHISAAMGWAFAGPPGTARRLPVTLPLAEIVAGLNDFQPSGLSVYPSMLHRLLLEAAAGRLTIAPWRIVTGGEPLLPETRRLCESLFGACLLDFYACSEAWGMAQSYPGTADLHLIEDAAVYEPVHQDGRPAQPGETASCLLVTNVINQVLPLIRYQITDEVTVLDGPNPGPWTGRRIAAVAGRLDDEFVYSEGVVVHPHIFESALGHVAEIAEYQVRQTLEGAEILVRLAGRSDLALVRQELIRSLQPLGLRAPQVTISPVARIEHTSVAGKLKRFVPLTPALRPSPSQASGKFPGGKFA